MSIPRISKPFIIMAIGLAVSLQGSPACAITPGQVDDFQDGTVQNWGPVFALVANNIPDAGPGGIGDHALSITSTGNPALRAGSRSVSVNTAQWTGDWSGQGVTAIEFDARNPGSEPLELWLGIVGPLGTGSGGVGDTYVSLASAPLAAGSDWSRYSIPVTAGDFETATNHTGVGNIGDALGGVTHFRIFHNVEGRNDPDLPNNFVGDVIQAEFQLDNITAVSVPEPASMGRIVLFTVTACGLGLRRRRK